MFHNKKYPNHKTHRMASIFIVIFTGMYCYIQFNRISIEGCLLLIYEYVFK